MTCFGHEVKAMIMVQQHVQSSTSANLGRQPIPGTEGLHMANTQQQRRCCHSQACLDWGFRAQPKSGSRICSLLLCSECGSQCTGFIQVALLTLTATKTSVNPSFNRAEPLACTSCPVSSTTDRSSSVPRPSLLTS